MSSRSTAGTIIRGPRKSCCSARIPPSAPWWIVDAVDKRRARLNCIRHLLGQVPYQELPLREIVLPEELLGGDHARRSGSAAMHVPEVY